MNIFYWTDGYFPRIGGIETQGLCLTKEIRNRGHSCTVLANQDEPTVPEMEAIEGINIYRFNFSLFKNPDIDAQELLKIVEEKILLIFDKTKPDVIHLYLYFCYQSYSAFIYLLLRKKLPYPVVLTLHTVPERQSFNFLTRFFENADRICCVSESVFDAIRIYAPSVLSKTRVISNALSTPALQPTPLSFEPPIFLCLGRFSNEKGFDLAIQAFAQVQAQFPGAKLVLAGSGLMQRIYEKLIDDLDLSKSVSFTGSISIENVPASINQSSIVLIPSHIESFCLVALEAAQMERPVIASAVGGLLEVVVNEKTGILIPPHDIDELSKAMIRLLNNPSQATEMGKQARIRALKEFSAEHMVNAYEDVYSFLKEQKAKKELALESLN